MWRLLTSMQFFETIIFTFIPVMIDLPVAIVVLWVKYDITIVSIVFVVSVILYEAIVCATRRLG